MAHLSYCRASSEVDFFLSLPVNGSVKHLESWGGYGESRTKAQRGHLVIRAVNISVEARLDELALDTTAAARQRSGAGLVGSKSR